MNETAVDILHSYIINLQLWSPIKNTKTQNTTNDMLNFCVIFNVGTLIYVLYTVRLDTCYKILPLFIILMSQNSFHIIPDQKLFISLMLRYNIQTSVSKESTTKTDHRMLREESYISRTGLLNPHPF
jgi:hypothetical protein